jgi:hypothetical protein
MVVVLGSGSDDGLSRRRMGRMARRKMRKKRARWRRPR